MSYDKACAPRRTIARRLFPVGVLVVTPTGRIARVVGHYDDGRLALQYCGGPRHVEGGPDDVALLYSLVREPGDNT